MSAFQFMWWLRGICRFDGGSFRRHRRLAAARLRILCGWAESEADRDFAYWAFDIGVSVTAEQAHLLEEAGFPVGWRCVATRSDETAAAAAELEDRFSGLPRVNVKDYGAVGDGATDETAAFYAALAAAPSVYFPPGRYVIDDLDLGELADRDVVEIVGADPFTTQLVHKGLARGEMIRAEAGRLKGLAVRDIALDGNKDEQRDPKCNLARLNLDWLLVRRCRFTRSVAQAVQLDVLGGAALVEGCRFSGMARHSGLLNEVTGAFGWGPPQRTDATLHFAGNVVEAEPTLVPGGGPQGLCVHRAGGRLVAIDNTLIGCGQDPVRPDGTALGNPIAGITMYRDCDGLIAGNRFRDITHAAIRAHRSSRLTIERNTVIGQGRLGATGCYAIAIQDRAPEEPCSELTVRDNVVRNVPDMAGAFAVFAGHKAGCRFSQVAVTGNRAENAREGFFLARLDGVVLKGNRTERVAKPRVLVDVNGLEESGNSWNEEPTQ